MGCKSRFGAVLCVALVALRLCGSCPTDTPGCGGWNHTSSSPLLLSGRCNIQRVHATQLSAQAFTAGFLEHEPVIVEGVQNELVRLLTTKERLLEEHGSSTIVLSTSNTISHNKVTSKLRDYLLGLTSQNPDQLGNETLYLFGPASELGSSLAELTGLYKRPMYAGADFAFSFGIGASGSGVPFHVHGHGFSEVLHGRKRWLLSPPNRQPLFDPDASSAAWLRDVYPSLQAAQMQMLKECVIGPGELLYFPSMWWHAIVNIGETVFMSSFLRDQGPTSSSCLPF